MGHHEEVPLLKKKPLSFWKFIFLSYFCVCGGPYGLELAIGQGYPLITLILLLVVPWVWSLPMALATAELSSAMPDNDGLVMWIKGAFGPYWAFVGAAMSWFNYVIDNASYPVLFMSYLYHLHPSGILADPFYYMFIQFSVIFGVTVMNLMGVDIVGNASFIFALLTLSPFLVLAGWSFGLGMIIPSDWVQLPPVLKLDGIFVAVNIVIWGYSGFETLGQIVEELEDPKRNFSKAMYALVVMTIITYLIAFFGAVGLDEDYSHWEEGHYAVLAYQLGGDYFKTAMVIAAMMSCVGIYNALMCTSSQELRAFGKRDLLGSRPLRWKHPTLGTPWIAILVNSTFITLFSLFPFQDLILVNNIVYAILLLMLYATLIKLRFSRPNMVRPYIISQSNLLTIYFCIPPVLLCFYIMGSALQHSVFQFGIVAVAYGLFSVVYGCLYAVRSKK